MNTHPRVTITSVRINGREVLPQPVFVAVHDLPGADPLSWTAREYHTFTRSQSPHRVPRRLRRR